MNPLRSVAALAALLGLACGGSGEAREDGAVVLHASNSAELSALSRAFAEAQAAGAEQVEVVLAPGTYADTTLTLQDRGKPPTVQLDIRSAGPGPAILHNTRLSLKARAISLEGLVVEDWQGAESPVVVAVGESLTIAEVTFRRLAPQPHSTPAVHIKGLKRSGPKTIRIADSWMRDSAAEQLILIDASASDPVAEASLARVGFVGNTAQTLLFGYALRTLHAEEIAAADPAVDSLLWCAWSENTVTLTGSALALSGRQPWLRRDANPPDPSITFAEPVITGSMIEPGGAAPESAPEHLGELLRWLQTP